MTLAPAPPGAAEAARQARAAFMNDIADMMAAYAGNPDLPLPDGRVFSIRARGATPEARLADLRGRIAPRLGAPVTEHDGGWYQAARRFGSVILEAHVCTDGPGTTAYLDASAKRKAAAA
jgi:hypothetical protein